MALKNGIYRLKNTSFLGYKFKKFCPARRVMFAWEKWNSKIGRGGGDDEMPNICLWNNDNIVYAQITLEGKWCGKEKETEGKSRVKKWEKWGKTKNFTDIIA